MYYLVTLMENSMRLFILIILLVCKLGYQPVEASESHVVIDSKHIEIFGREGSLDFSQKYPELEKITFTPYWSKRIWTFEELEKFNSTDNLRETTYYYNTRSSDLGLSNNKNLKSISFEYGANPYLLFLKSSYPQVTDLEINEQVDLHMLYAFPNVKSLSWVSRMGLKKQQYEIFIKYIPNLEKLTFGGTLLRGYNISLEDIEGISWLSNLKEVTVNLKDASDSYMEQLQAYLKLAAPQAAISLHNHKDWYLEGKPTLTRFP